MINSIGGGGGWNFLELLFPLSLIYELYGMKVLSEEIDEKDDEDFLCILLPVHV